MRGDSNRIFGALTVPILCNSLDISLYRRHCLLRYFDPHVTDLLFIYVTIYLLLRV